MPTSIHAAGPSGQRSPGLDAAIAGYLAEHGGGGGVELASGAVTLDGTGSPVREFYTTASATINGVAFPAGTAVVFRRTPAGVWGYIVVDPWTDLVATTTTTTTAATTTTTTTAATTTTTTTAATTTTTTTATGPLVFDDFNRADSSTGLGTAPTGQTWVNDLSIIGIVSNQAKRISGAARSIIEVGQRNMYVSAQFNGVSSSGHSLYARFADANNYYAVDTGASGLSPKLISKMGGTDYIHGTAYSMALGDRYGIRVTDRAGGGATVDLMVNDVAVYTLDHAASTIVGTKAGMYLGTANITFDNFQVDPA